MPSSNLQVAPADTVPAVIAEVSVQGVRVNHRGNWLFVKVETRDGHVGLGEVSQSGDDAQVAAFILQRLAPKLIGHPLVGPRSLLRELRGQLAAHGPLDRVRATALSGIEQALWDVFARVLQVSIQTLLGGPLRTSIRLYANINRSLEERSPEAFARAARGAVSDGFTAIKIAPFDGVNYQDGDHATLRRAISAGLTRAFAVREAIGHDVALMIDCHGRFSRELAIDVARELEPLGLFWLEDLLWAEEDPDGLAAVGAVARQPLAAGERTLSLEGFFPIVSRRLAATVMPDIKHCGGLDEARRIAALAESARLHVSPHNPAGPVATLASAHLAGTLTHFAHLEYAWGEVPFREALLDPPERIIDGQLELPLGPGFGAQLNEALIAEHAFDPL
ncbi:MAG: mandelate racemase/muconate lactonizing enzyme family protein, partial [Polyangiales bacterium]